MSLESALRPLPQASKKRLPFVASILTCEAAGWGCLCSLKAASDVGGSRTVQGQVAQLDLPLKPQGGQASGPIGTNVQCSW